MIIREYFPVKPCVSKDGNKEKVGSILVSLSEIIEKVSSEKTDRTATAKLLHLLRKYAHMNRKTEAVKKYSEKYDKKIHILSANVQVSKNKYKSYCST